MIDGWAGLAKNESMPGAAIEIENLTKDYPFGFLHLKKKRSLEGLTMQVESGEVFGFLGPNGAGKSTTIKLLVGLIFPDAGSARILGKSITDIEMHRDIGYLPEQPYFYDYLTAAEVLDYFARFHDLTATDRRERVSRMLQKVGLETAGKIQLRKYSKGMLQRVGLAQAILHDPKAALYVAGLFVEEMRTFHFTIPNPPVEALLRGLSYLLPNFENFNVMAAAAHGRHIPLDLILQNTAYAALYCAIVLLIAIAVFSRRNLK